MKKFTLIEILALLAVLFLMVASIVSATITVHANYNHNKGVPIRQWQQVAK